MSLPIKLRLATPADLKFVGHSWFESYRRGGHAPRVGGDVYKAGQGRVIDELLATGTVIIASHEELTDEICGYAVWNAAVAGRIADTLHYCYVKQAYRRYGVARRLLGNQFIWHTHETRIGRIVAAKLGLASRFNPYLAMVPRESFTLPG